MKRIRSGRNVFLIGGLAALFVLLYWVWLFYMTQPATERNTYKCSEAIIDVEIYLAPHRGSDKLYMISQNHCYMIDTGWRNENKSNELAENILSGGENHIITLWKHIPKSLVDARGNGVWVYQAVDVRDNEEIYWNIESHNSFQKSERIVGIVTGAFLSVVTVIFDLLFCCPLRKKKISKH